MDADEARRMLTQWSTGRLERVSFAGMDLISVHMRGWFDRCDFSGTDLRQSTLSHAHFKMCTFQGANLRGTEMRGVWLSGCDMRNADLRDTDMTDATLGYVNTGEGDIGRTDMTGARLEGAVLTGITADRILGWMLPPT